MSHEPPSLAARLEQDGPLPWREAARLAARIARGLDRLHAQGKVHGGVEPRTVLFVGGTVRLADPLPPAARSAAFVPPGVAAGAPPDRQSDFFALGRTMAAMLAGDAGAPDDVPDLPPPLAAVQRRLVGAAGAAGYGSGNDVAAALELAIAASEGLAAMPAPAPPPLEPRPPPAPPPVPPRAPAGPAARASGRRPRLLVGALAGLLVLAGLAVLWLWPAAELPHEAPPPEALAPAAPPEPHDARTASSEAAPVPAEPDAAAPVPLEEVLAALPAVPLAPPPALPDTRTQLEALLAEVATRPCSRLEVEPTPVGLRLVGSTRSAADRTAMLAAVAGLHDVDHVAIGLDAEDAYCRLYDLLAGRAAVALPRLADLYPSRADYRLAASEPLVVRVLTPDFASHVVVDYFTADGMVVHLTKHAAEPEPLAPRTELRIGDPVDGQWLSIAEPFGHELILVLASRAPLFAEPRPQIEAAEAYLEALEAALAAQDEPPMASTMAILTVPAGP